jgi:hypothetical protein
MSSIKKIFLVPSTFGANRFFLFYSRLPSNASCRFFEFVFPEKLTNAGSSYSFDVIKKSLAITDLPTPVSPLSKVLYPLYISV